MGLIAFVYMIALPVAQASFLSNVTGLFSAPASASVIESVGANKSQTMPLLKAALNTDPTPYKQEPEVLMVNGTSLLSEAGPAGTIVDTQNMIGVFDNGQIITYVVRSGDTLPQIAAAFDVSVKTIQIANDLRTTTIKEGQRLVILPISGVRHKVISGETLSGLAKAYKVEVDEIIQYNHLEASSKLVIGDIIFIPSDEVPASSVPNRNISNTSTIASTNNTTGYFMKPIANYRRTQGIHGHNGVDLAAPAGTSIVAAASGEVILARVGGWNGGYGNYVVIQHPNGTQTLYSHATQVFVTEGQWVKQGQRIATVGSTGKSTGAHLHFEVRGGKNPF